MPKRIPDAVYPAGTGTAGARTGDYGLFHIILLFLLIITIIICIIRGVRIDGLYFYKGRSKEIYGV